MPDSERWKPQSVKKYLIPKGVVGSTPTPSLPVVPGDRYPLDLISTQGKDGIIQPLTP